MLRINLFDKSTRAAWKLRFQRRLPISEAKEGELVKVVGRLVGDHESPLRSPIGDRECVAWQVDMEDFDTYAGSGWLPVCTDAAVQALVIEDETGRAVLDCAKPILVYGNDPRLFSYDDLSRAMVTFALEHGVDEETLKNSYRRFQFYEHILEPGAAVTALGQARWEPDPDGGARGAGYRDAPMRLVLEAAGKAAVIVSNDEKLMR